MENSTEKGSGEKNTQRTQAKSVERVFHFYRHTLFTIQLFDRNIFGGCVVVVVVVGILNVLNIHARIISYYFFHSVLFIFVFNHIH